MDPVAEKNHLGKRVKDEDPGECLQNQAQTMSTMSSHLNDKSSESTEYYDHKKQCCEVAQLHKEEPKMEGGLVDGKNALRKCNYSNADQDVYYGASNTNRIHKRVLRRRLIKLSSSDDEDSRNKINDVRHHHENLPKTSRKLRRWSYRIAKLPRKNYSPNTARSSEHSIGSEDDDDDDPEFGTPIEDTETSEYSSEFEMNHNDLRIRSRVIKPNVTVMAQAAPIVETKTMSRNSLLRIQEQVKERLCTFSALYMKASVKEEERVKKFQLTPQSSFKFHGRPDMKVLQIMLSQETSKNLPRMIGEIPGTCVNQSFISKVEMAVVGMHKRVMGGIDFVSKVAEGSSSISCDRFLPLAVCVVLAGRYDDEANDLDEIVYVGEGGRDPRGRVYRDQRLLGGNLGLQNSMKHSKPVRVVRKRLGCRFLCYGSYTYLGLYQVVDSTYKKEKSGYLVFRFTLRRLPGQAAIERIPAIPSSDFFNEVDHSASSDSISTLQK